jgi:HSP20 family protein
MTLMRFDPYRELDRLSEHAVLTSRAVPMEAFRRDDQCIVALDLPGVDSKDVDVTVERNVVMVKVRRDSLRQENDEVLIDERPHGEFIRQLFLGDMLTAGDLTAEFDRGVLVLTVPIAESSKPRMIKVSEQTAVKA